MKTRTPFALERKTVGELPYVGHLPTDGRNVPILTYCDPTEPHMTTWAPTKAGGLQFIKVVDVIFGTYVGFQAKEDTDIPLSLSYIIHNHLSYDDVTTLTHSAVQDFVGLLASIEKYFILLSHKNACGSGNVEHLVKIEIESIFGMYRSFYDLLQEIIAFVIKRHHPNKPDLPKSFRRIVEKTPEELAEKYFLPPNIITFYKEKQLIFTLTRQIRDNIYHNGVDLGAVFSFPDGFAVSTDVRPWKDLSEQFPLWPKERQKDNRLGSALLIYCLLVEDAFKTMQFLADCILGSFCPPPTAMFKDGVQVYLRTTFNKHLGQLDTYEKEQWFDPDSVLDERRAPTKEEGKKREIFQYRLAGQLHRLYY